MGKNVENLLVGLEISAATVEISRNHLKMLKIKLSFDPLGSMHQEESMPTSRGDVCACVFERVFFTLVKLGTQLRHPSTDDE